MGQWMGGACSECSESGAPTKPDAPNPVAAVDNKSKSSAKVPSKAQLQDRAKRWESLVGRRDIVAKPQFSEKSRNIVRNWIPRPTDVLIATPAKTGTTWLQQLTHQLRTGGDMDFDDVYQVSPWQLMAFDLGLDMDGDQPLHKPNATPFFPRIYKTHQLPSANHPGCKHLVTVRSPPKVWSSAYRFFKAKDLPPLRNVTGMNDLKAYGCTVKDMGFGGSLFDYYVEFWKLRNEDNLLIICYEDLIKDTRKYVPLIANFLGLPEPSKELIDKVLKMSGKEFMAKHMKKFDESWCYEKLKEHGTHDRPDDFRPSDRVSKAVPVSKEVVDFLQKEWDTYITPETGHKNYEEFRNAVRKVTAARIAALPSAAPPAVNDDAKVSG